MSVVATPKQTNRIQGTQLITRKGRAGKYNKKNPLKAKIK